MKSYLLAGALWVISTFSPEIQWQPWEPNKCWAPLSEITTVTKNIVTGLILDSGISQPWDVCSVKVSPFAGTEKIWFITGSCTNVTGWIQELEILSTNVFPQDVANILYTSQPGGRENIVVSCRSDKEKARPEEPSPKRYPGTYLA